ncbi:MAG: hypothetical protein LBG47_04845 [Prevotellaceae bacterium]|nr:hypothetical protein [Prevotellaceae bacterium]
MHNFYLNKKFQHAPKFYAAPVLVITALPNMLALHSTANHRLSQKILTFMRRTAKSCDLLFSAQMRQIFMICADFSHLAAPSSGSSAA